LWLPNEIFEFDLMPTADGPEEFVMPGKDLSWTS